MRADITQVLKAIDQGDPRSSSHLLPMVYDELRKLAAARLAKERPGQSLQATALVHEAYLRLLGPEGQAQGNWDGRGHFFAAAAEAMRRILIDRARAKGAVKRGADWRRMSIDLSTITLDAVPPEILDLDDALVRFKAEEPEQAALVELRFFAGLTMAQAASVLGISPATAGRYWAHARAWLYSDLSESGETAPGA